MLISRRNESKMRRIIQMLTDRNLKFVRHENEDRLTIENRWDFWPVTEIYLDGIGGKLSVGIFNLFADIKEER